MNLGLYNKDYPMKSTVQKLFTTKLLLVWFIGTFLYSNHLMSQTEVTREEFYQFLTNYIENLQQILLTEDTTLTELTNLELKIRLWNDYVVQKLPKRFAVKVPLDNVQLKKQKYNRAEVKIDYNFEVNFPVENFRFEDNLPDKNIALVNTIKNINDQGWYEIHPVIDMLIVEANQARKYNVVKNKGYLLFGIKIALSREGGWTQFYQTVVSFDWVKWMVEDGTIWEVEPLPIEELFFKK